MGQALSALWASWFPGEHKIVMVGLDNAGKTTILYRLHLGEAVKTQATIGSNVETVKHNNLTFEVWDLGGQANLRPSWSLYFANAVRSPPPPCRAVPVLPAAAPVWFQQPGRS